MATCGRCSPRRRSPCGCREPRGAHRPPSDGGRSHRDNRRRPPAARPPSTAARAPRRAHQHGSGTAPGAGCGSSRPRALELGLALSLSELGPEARTRVRRAAALRVVLRLHGGGSTTSSPRRRPESREHLTQAVPHPSSSTRSREAAIRRRGKGRMWGRPPSRAPASQRAPTSHAGWPHRVDARARPPWGWTGRSWRRRFAACGSLRRDMRCLYPA